MIRQPLEPDLMPSGAEQHEVRGDVVAVLDAERGSVICERCELADNPWRRLRGLLGRASLAPGEGLMLRPTGAIHTFFMRFPIDAVFVDSDLRVIEVRERLRPWRGAAARGARAVLELPADEGRRRGITIGARLSLAEPDGHAPARAPKTDPSLPEGKR
jgi:uncharacterized membrane protein (UPF0127 family)